VKIYFLFVFNAFKKDQRFVTLCVRAIFYSCVFRKDKIFGTKTLRFFSEGILNKEIFYHCVLSVFLSSQNFIAVYKKLNQIQEFFLERNIKQITQFSQKI